MTAAATHRSRSSISAMPVEDAMHQGVLTCARDAPLSEVAHSMAEQRVHCIVVSDGADAERGEGLWGVVADVDIVAAALAGVLELQTAGEAAASPVVMVSPQETLDRAAQLMLEHATDHLVVMDPTQLRPVGVLSTLDIAAAVGGRVSLEEMSS